MKPESPTVYGPDPLLAHPLRLLRTILRELRFSKHLMLRLFLKDVMSQHRQSLLGLWWVLVPSIITTLLWYFLNRSQLVTVAETELPYPLFVLAGTTAWTTFATAIQKPLMAFGSGLPVLTKLRVPPEAYIISAAAQTFVVDFMVKLILLVLVAALMGHPLPFTLPLALLVGACIVIVGTAIGLLCVPLGTLYNDIGRLLPLVLGIGMYLAPVVYPAPQTGLAAVLVGINPGTWLVGAFRQVALGGTGGDFAYLMWITAAAIGLLAVGAILLRAALPHIIARSQS